VQLKHIYGESSCTQAEKDLGKPEVDDDRVSGDLIDHDVACQPQNRCFSNRTPYTVHPTPYTLNRGAPGLRIDHDDAYQATPGRRWLLHIVTLRCKRVSWYKFHIVAAAGC